ncbi:MAG: type IV secretory system conjugative DNA transfer family protein [Pleurocapsa sp. CRU_1_2]|nr:type IV secretory system conjugative DNA transfer family protein [Pleurocapsa sp. CRU_1_2]
MKDLSLLLLGISTYSEMEGYSTHNEKDAGLKSVIGRESVGHGGEGHLLTVAPTGSGKGRTAIIPNLLHYKGSVVVIDPKGENYAVTSRYRRQMGHQVIKLDPFGVIDSESDRLNPFDIFRLKNADLETDAQVLAELLTTGNKSFKEPFWDLSAKGLYSGLISHVQTLYPHQQRNLNSVRKLLINQDVTIGLAKILDNFGDRMNQMAHDEIAAFLMMPEQNTKPSVLATAVSYIKFMMSDRVARTLENSSFSLNDVVAGKPLSIYIIIPPDKLKSHQALLRLWIGTLFKAFTSRRQIPKLPTLLMLDECAQLGNFAYLETLITLCRGYGVKVWSFWQDLSQLRQLYPQSWETIINNCAVLQFFGAKNYKMSQDIGQLVGVDANDVRYLSEQEQIIVKDGTPLKAQRFDYLNHLLFKNRCDVNPFYSRSICK